MNAGSLRSDEVLASSCGRKHVDYLIAAALWHHACRLACAAGFAYRKSGRDHAPRRGLERPVLFEALVKGTCWVRGSEELGPELCATIGHSCSSLAAPRWVVEETVASFTYRNRTASPLIHQAAVRDLNPTLKTLGGARPGVKVHVYSDGTAPKRNAGPGDGVEDIRDRRMRGKLGASANGHDLRRALCRCRRCWRLQHSLLSFPECSKRRGCWSGRQE